MQTNGQKHAGRMQTNGQKHASRMQTNGQKHASRMPRARQLHTSERSKARTAAAHSAALKLHASPPNLGLDGRLGPKTAAKVGGGDHPRFGVHRQSWSKSGQPTYMHSRPKLGASRPTHTAAAQFSALQLHVAPRIRGRTAGWVQKQPPKSGAEKHTWEAVEHTASKGPKGEVNTTAAGKSSSKFHTAGYKKSSRWHTAGYKSSSRWHTAGYKKSSRWHTAGGKKSLRCHTAAGSGGG
jgi:hypothetical protein